MFGIDTDLLVQGLENLRKQVCAYGPYARTCDCKFGIPAEQKYMFSEQTGCPELRQAIKILQGKGDEILVLDAGKALDNPA